MAIVKGPLHSEAASGNMGDLCYSRWRGLWIVRSSWTGTQGSSAEQLVVRANMTAVSQAWGGTLTKKQREAWISVAPEYQRMDQLGEQHCLSGYELFCRWNMLRKMFSQNIDTIPGLPTKNDTEDLTFYYDAPTPKMVVYLRGMDGSFIKDCWGELQAAGPYGSEGRRPVNGDWRTFSRQLIVTYAYHTAGNNGEWWWYRGRGVQYCGNAGNWITEQKKWA